MTTSKLLVALFTSTLLASSALACPLGNTQRRVSATMTTVTIDGARWDVAGEVGRASFQNMLLSCGEDSAAGDFDRWRNARVVTNVTGAGGVLFPPLWIGTAGAALLSGDHRRDLVTELRTPVMPAVADASD